MRIHGWTLLATLGVLGVAIGATAWWIAPANAAVETYDLTMNVKAMTTNGIRLRVRATGEMTYDTATGAFSFDVSEVDAPPEFRIRGAGLLSDAEKAIGMTTYNTFTDPDSTPDFTGNALFVGRFKRGGATFVGKLTAVSDNNGTAPWGYTYNVGKVRAVRR